MRKIMLAFLAVVAAIAFTGCSAGASAGEKLDVATFLAKASSPGVVVIDVRTPDEFAAGHLAGAVNIDVEGPDFDARIAALDTGVTYAVYCRSGRRSAIAAQRMADAGFASVYDLQGGIADLAAGGARVITS